MTRPSLQPPTPGPALPGPWLALSLVVGAVAVYVGQALPWFLLEGGGGSPADAVPALDPISLGGPLLWMLALGLRVLPRGHAQPFVTVLVGVAAYVAGLGLGLLLEDSRMRSGGWGLGGDVVFVVMMATGAWLAPLVCSIAVAVLTRRRG